MSLASFRQHARFGVQQPWLALQGPKVDGSAHAPLHESPFIPLWAVNPQHGNRLETDWMLDDTRREVPSDLVILASNQHLYSYEASYIKPEKNPLSRIFEKAGLPYGAKISWL